MTKPRNTTVRDRHRAAIARGQPVCGLCGYPIDYSLGWEKGSDGRRHPNPAMFVVDHIVPLDAGGTDTLKNKQAAHWKCNDAKRAKPHSSTIRKVEGVNW